MELTKKMKAQVRALADLLYQKELNVELAKLDAHFELWRQGKLSPFDLAAQIHEFSKRTLQQVQLQRPAPIAGGKSHSRWQPLSGRSAK
jgi:hypothetical protein